MVGGFLSYRSPLLSVGMERSQVTDDLTGADQKIPGWLIKITFLGESKTSVRSSVQAGFGVAGSQDAWHPRLPQSGSRGVTLRRQELGCSPSCPRFKNT